MSFETRADQVSEEVARTWAAKCRSPAAMEAKRIRCTVMMSLRYGQYLAHDCPSATLNHEVQFRDGNAPASTSVHDAVNY